MKELPAAASHSRGAVKEPCHIQKSPRKKPCNGAACCSGCYAALKTLFFVESMVATVLWHVQVRSKSSAKETCNSQKSSRKEPF